jgi:hypothetical protein
MTRRAVVEQDWRHIFAKGDGGCRFIAGACVPPADGYYCEYKARAQAQSNSSFHGVSSSERLSESLFH